MSQQAGESCGTGGGACPSIRGIPLPFLIMLVLVIYTVGHGAWTRASATDGAAPAVPSAVTAYHAPMEAIVRASQSGGMAGPGPEAVAEIRAALPEAMERWSAVEAAPHDAVYGLTPALVARRAGLLAAERAALDELARAVDAGDAPAIGRAGSALEPVVARLVLLYGERDG